MISQALVLRSLQLQVRLKADRPQASDSCYMFLLTVLYNVQCDVVWLFCTSIEQLRQEERRLKRAAEAIGAF